MNTDTEDLYKQLCGRLGEVWDWLFMQELKSEEKFRELASFAVDERVNREFPRGKALAVASAAVDITAWGGGVSRSRRQRLSKPQSDHAKRKKPDRK